MLRTVFDVNVWLHGLIGPKSEFPYLTKVPPRSPNSSADCISLAFDGDRFSVFISPHILKNISRVLREAGLSQQTISRFCEDIVEIVIYSQGSVLDPERKVVELVDHEDNLILDLVSSTDSDVLVTADNELLSHSGWRGKIFLRPRDFVSLALRIAPQ